MDQILNEGAFDLLLIYKFIKRISTPFTEQDAYRLGIIDEDGNKVRSPKTRLEKNSYQYVDRLIFNLKKIIEKVPGGKSKLGSFAAALFLIREGEIDREYSMDELVEGFSASLFELEGKRLKTYQDLVENTPTNATGASVVGTGDTGDAWRGKGSKRATRRFMAGKKRRKGGGKRDEIMSRYGLGVK